MINLIWKLINKLMTCKIINLSIKCHSSPDSRWFRINFTIILFNILKICTYRRCNISHNQLEEIICFITPPSNHNFLCPLCIRIFHNTKSLEINITIHLFNSHKIIRS